MLIRRSSSLVWSLLLRQAEPAAANQQQFASKLCGSRSGLQGLEAQFSGIRGLSAMPSGGCLPMQLYGLPHGSALSQARQLSAMAEKKPAEKFDSLEITDEKINAITDQIPQRPMGVVEGTSYSLVIVFAFGALAFFIWQFVVNFILEPTAMQCFNHTLERLKTDPRITVRLGSSDEIRAWGSNSQSRVARQQVPHQIYKDAQGVEHARIQFYMRGPSGTAQVHADMYKDSAGQWQYTYLLVDVYSNGSQSPSRVHIVSPH